MARRLRRSLSPLGALVTVARWTILVGAVSSFLGLGRMHGPSGAPAARPALLRLPGFHLASRAVSLFSQRLAHATRFLALDLGRGRALSALQMMKQRRSNVGRAVAFFQQAFDELILPLELAALERGAHFVEHHAGARRFHLINAGRPVEQVDEHLFDEDCVERHERQVGRHVGVHVAIAQAVVEPIERRADDLFDAFGPRGP